MRKLLVVLAIPLMGFGCGPSPDASQVELGDDVDWGARNAPWEVDPCDDFSGDAADLQLACTMDDSWSMEDKNIHSPYFGQQLRPETLGKVSLWAYYWAECGTCIQQLAFLQVLKDDLTNQGYDVEIVGVAYNNRTGEVGTLGTSPRPGSGACNGARAAYPSCSEGDNITLTIPVVVDPGRIAGMHEVQRGDWFVYRPDGKLHKYINSEHTDEMVANAEGRFNGHLTMQENWDWLVDQLKTAAMAPYGGKEPCSALHECGERDQWCQFPDGQCGGQGHCVTTELPARSNQSVGDVSSVCGAGVGPEYVCGCDQFTYKSRCLAEMYGVSISHLGKCRED